MSGNTDPYYVLMGRVIQKFRKAARMKQHELAADLKTTRGHTAHHASRRCVWSHCEIAAHRPATPGSTARSAA